MVALDQRGDIAIATIVFYVPIFAAALLLTLRHGFGREAGWVFLLTFSIIRIVGGALHIAAEEVTPPKLGLYIAAFAIESGGVAPLLLCTLSWLSLARVKSQADHPLLSRTVMRVLRVAITVAFALIVVGATDATNHSASKRNTGTTLRKVGSVVIVAAFAIMVVQHVIAWTYSSRLALHHRRMLVGVSAAVPFLIVRVIYSVLSAFSPISSFGRIPVSAGTVPTHHNALSKFSSFSGSWAIFLVMSLLMEYIVVLIYLAVGALTPLHEVDVAGGPSAEWVNKEGSPASEPRRGGAYNGATNV